MEAQHSHSTNTAPEAPPVGTGRAGRPRSEKARKAILGAAIEIVLDRGLDAMTMDDVASRAGVSKATIYRWWPSKELLALEAVQRDFDASFPPAPQATGLLREDMLARTRAWLSMMQGRSMGRVIAGLANRAQADPEFAQVYLDRFVEPRRELARQDLRRAIERGELPPGTDLDLALDLVFGVLEHRLLHGHARLDHEFAEKVVDAALAGLRHTGPKTERR
jgi:AcrR family transcriptional regulator